MWAMSHFYGGADDVDPRTCFTANTPLCMVCEVCDSLCEVHVDIQSHLCTLLDTVQCLRSVGLSTITKTLLVGTLMGANTQYIEGHEEMKDIIDKADTCWGCGISINGTQMGVFAWQKLSVLLFIFHCLIYHFYFALLTITLKFIED